jgi:hypothetical protein
MIAQALSKYFRDGNRKVPATHGFAGPFRLVLVLFDALPFALAGLHWEAVCDTERP